ncbi:MAG TPA: penicillin-binding transpeptidase domain-containing protein, partial [Chitinophagaceae bacterium]|nr:penicillin-binding transpeptidase domain-containing protein [Chitinophagaceae bacterium]
GPENFADFLGKINIPTKVEPFPSIALGSCDLSLFEMMWGYSIFAGRGFSTKPYFITRIEDRNGNVIKRFDYSMNRKEAISEITAYRMARMMQGTVDVGTATGLRNRLGAAEMAGKTGTTNDNADAWYMGYTPQLLGGVWIGCDDRFIRNESSGGYGGAAARPIWEAFFKKVYADKSLGIERDAKFVQPADYTSEINSADFIPTETDPNPEAEGIDQGVGTADDYNYIGPESKPVVEDEGGKPIKKDTTDNKADKKKSDAKPIGSPQEPKKKKGFLKKLFGKKEDQ